MARSLGMDAFALRLIALSRVLQPTGGLHGRDQARLVGVHQGRGHACAGPPLRQGQPVHPLHGSVLALLCSVGLMGGISSRRVCGPAWPACSSAPRAPRAHHTTCPVRAGCQHTTNQHRCHNLPLPLRSGVPRFRQCCASRGPQGGVRRPHAKRLGAHGRGGCWWSGVSIVAPLVAPLKVAPHECVWHGCAADIARSLRDQHPPALANCSHSCIPCRSPLQVEEVRLLPVADIEREIKARREQERRTGAPGRLHGVQQLCGPPLAAAPTVARQAL